VVADSPDSLDGPAWLNSAEQRAWRAYLDGTRLLFHALDRQLERDADLSLSDYELLVRLSEAPGQQLRMRELTHATLSTRSGVTRAVTRLENAGWVRRVDCEDDRRGTLAELTPSGARKLAAAAPGHVAAVRAHMLDRLSPRQLATVRAVGEQLQDGLQDAPP
jgi:DNA-binding MarR family transcriptional regulator